MPSFFLQAWEPGSLHMQYLSYSQDFAPPDRDLGHCSFFQLLFWPFQPFFFLFLSTTTTVCLTPQPLSVCQSSLKVPQDCSFVIINHLWRCIALCPWDFKTILSRMFLNTISATRSWRYMYVLSASILHPVVMCLKVSGAFLHLHQDLLILQLELVSVLLLLVPLFGKCCTSW